MRNYEEVRIMKVNKGYIVHVGCQTFVSSDLDEIVRGIKEYWADPVEARKKYEEGYADDCGGYMADRPVRANR